LRIVPVGGARPRSVERVLTNAVICTAVQDGEEQYFSAGGFGSPGEFKLSELPVRETELSVMENGEWRQWSRIDSLLFAGSDDEVYEFDGETGIIRFGAGTFGKTPPKGDRNIRVRYTFGGGSNGNLPVGAVDSLVGSIPHVTGVANITSMSGGAQAAPQDKAERLGKNRFRHRFTPVSKRDFEDIVIERFERASMVRCYPGVNGLHGLVPGHVTVVVAFDGNEDNIAARRLCGDIFKYLAERCDCNLAADGRLHVLPAIALTISAECTVKLRELDAAQETTARISERLHEMIDRRCSEGGIGCAVGLEEIEAVVRDDSNVERLLRLLVRGQYVSGGKKHMPAPEDFGRLPFCVPRGGENIIIVE
jgi:predicted phage baseplate assembly protein